MPQENPVGPNEDSNSNLSGPPKGMVEWNDFYMAEEDYAMQVHTATPSLVTEDVIRKSAPSLRATPTSSTREGGIRRRRERREPRPPPRPSQSQRRRIRMMKRPRRQNVRFFFKSAHRRLLILLIRADSRNNTKESQ